LQQVHVAGHPLQQCVGDDHVDGPVRLPARDVCGHEREPAVDLQLTRGRHHVRRGVDADDARAGPAVKQRRGQRAGTAAEVHDVVRSRNVDTGEQLEEGPGPLVGVHRVLPRIPTHREDPQI
jgi:hypothetical protein